MLKMLQRQIIRSVFLTTDLFNILPTEKRTTDEAGAFAFFWDLYGTYRF